MLIFAIAPTNALVTELGFDLVTETGAALTVS
jgi:hypothetical protein